MWTLTQHLTTWSHNLTTYYESFMLTAVLLPPSTILLSNKQTSRPTNTAARLPSQEITNIHTQLKTPADYATRRNWTVRQCQQYSTTINDQSLNPLISKQLWHNYAEQTVNKRWQTQHTSPRSLMQGAATWKMQQHDSSTFADLARKFCDNSIFLLLLIW